MGFFYQRGFGSFTNTNPNVFANSSPVDNGAVWFVATAPFFSLFLESISSNKVAAVILWIFTYLLSVAVCVYDKKRVLSRLYDTKSLGKSHYIPLAYLFKRKNTTRMNGLYTVVGVISVLFALTYNGFTRFVLTNEQQFIATVKDTAVSELADFEKYDTITDETVEKALQNYLGDSVIWKCEKGKKTSIVTASSQINYNGELSSFKISFAVSYDGFKYEGIEIKELTINGKHLSNEKYSILLMQIFSKEDTKNKEYATA